MSKWGNKDWWTGQTEEQKARVEARDEKFQARKDKMSAKQDELQARGDELRAQITRGGKGDHLFKGQVSDQKIMTIFNDGTFAISGAFGKGSAPDELLGFENDADSMRRKSTTGRGAAALVTGGLSLAASNNRGVCYVTVTGRKTGVQTFTTKNPSNTLLASIRSLKAAADSVMSKQDVSHGPMPGESAPDIAEQIRKLADLHEAGILTDEEFAAKKHDLLGRM